MKQPRAANEVYRLPPPIFDARCKACWFTVGLLMLVVASFWSLDLQWAQFFSAEAVTSMGRFVGEFFPPDTSPAFLHKVAVAAWETLAMSAVGTLLAAMAGLALALPLCHQSGSRRTSTRRSGLYSSPGKRARSRSW